MAYHNDRACMGDFNSLAGFITRTLQDDRVVRDDFVYGQINIFARLDICIAQVQRCYNQRYNNREQRIRAGRHVDEDHNLAIARVGELLNSLNLLGNILQQNYNLDNEDGYRYNYNFLRNINIVYVNMNDGFDIFTGNISINKGIITDRIEYNVIDWFGAHYLIGGNSKKNKTSNNRKQNRTRRTRRTKRTKRM